MTALKQSQGLHISFALLAGVLVSLMALPAAASDYATMGEGADITAMCGSKPMTVALTDGYGGDTWRKIVLAEVQDELSKCPNVKRFIYTNANGNQQKSNSDINSLVSQGVDVMVTFTDFGDAMLPALRSAKKAGVTVVPYFSKISGTPGRDYTALVYQDQERVGELWADWFGSTIKEGNVLLLGGVPGASSSLRFMQGFKKGVQKYPGLHLLDDNYIVTNWTPSDAQKAVSGLIAKYSKIDGIASDFGATTLAAVKTFQQAGLAVPAQATLASSNELNCRYSDDVGAGKGWPYFSLDGTTTLARFAVRRAVAEFQGTPDPEPLAIVPFPSADSTKGFAPKCDPSAPPDADFSSNLSSEKLKQLF
ncbi:substrate-binding domain-containing protein [Pseudomonas sp. NPDC090203]|uniref:substrate-binding domain-containing protein n=1 Tax=Pseudomonas sp. NPDC090203 TaxID=3364477 RepID=UPI0037F1E77C